MNGTDSPPPPQSDAELAERPTSADGDELPRDWENAAGAEALRLADLSEAASDRIRRFVADSTVKGGASPADVADLYTAAEIVGDARATAYLDGRYVHGELPSDWRELQDDLTAVHRDAPRGTSGEGLLARLDQDRRSAQTPRSIFDDPEDLDEDVDETAARMSDRDPRLADLSQEARRSIERHLVAEVLGYGVAPIRTMELRDTLDAAGDERALQYLDLPFERGERPPDWDELRDRALRLRARLERRGWDSAELFAQVEAAHRGLEARELLAVLEERVEHGR